MSAEFPLPGGRELDAVLSALPMRMQRQAYRQALTAAAAPVRDEARLLAPKRTGKMAKAIRTGSPRQNSDGSFSVSVRLDGRGKGSHAYLGLFHEFGVAPHYLQGGDSGISARLLTRKAKTHGATSEAATKRVQIDGQFISGAVFHPGFAPRPFMRPALDAKADEAVKAFAEKIADFLESKTGFASPALGRAA